MQSKEGYGVPIVQSSEGIEYQGQIVIHDQCYWVLQLVEKAAPAAHEVKMIE